MQNIESTIVELGGIFQQLAHMVKEQEEMVERYKITFSELNHYYCYLFFFFLLLNLKNFHLHVWVISFFTELIPMFKMLN